jgi:MinD-like ATPase involved in chromosome partitioning or flagellar assembly
MEPPVLDHGFDQAEGLRQLMPRPSLGLLAFPLRADGDARWIAQLAHALRALGRRPVVLDAARGAVASAFGLRPRHELIDLLEGRQDFDAVAQATADGVYVLRADRGVEAFVAGGAPATELLGSFARLSHGFDELMLVMPAGELACLAGCKDSVPVVGLGPTADGTMRSYALIKQLAEGFGYQRFSCVMHDVRDPAQASREYTRLAAAAGRFLHAEVALAGSVPASVRACPAALARVARTLLETAVVPLSLELSAA